MAEVTLDSIAAQLRIVQQQLHALINQAAAHSRHFTRLETRLDELALDRQREMGQLSLLQLRLDQVEARLDALEREGDDVSRTVDVPTGHLHANVGAAVANMIGFGHAQQAQRPTGQSCADNTHKRHSVG
jgi:hypothetical protein